MHFGNPWQGDSPLLIWWCANSLDLKVAISKGRKISGGVPFHLGKTDVHGCANPIFFFFQRSGSRLLNFNHKSALPMWIVTNHILMRGPNLVFIALRKMTGSASVQGV